MFMRDNKDYHSRTSFNCSYGNHSEDLLINMTLYDISSTISFCWGCSVRFTPPMSFGIIGSILNLHQLHTKLQHATCYLYEVEGWICFNSQILNMYCMMRMIAVMGSLNIIQKIFVCFNYVIIPIRCMWRRLGYLCLWRALPALLWCPGHINSLCWLFVSSSVHVH